MQEGSRNRIMDRECELCGRLGLGNAIEELVAVAGAPLVSQQPNMRHAAPAMCRAVSKHLAVLLAKKNGFYAFESALHVLPVGRNGDLMDLESWNSDDLWRREYGGLAEGCVFFAEDVFGGQFCIHEDRICSFDPETAELTELAQSIASWAELMLMDYRVLTGFPLAHRWQEINSPLPMGQRLSPRRPFVSGGEFTPENLFAIDAVAGMRAYGNLARQIRDLPDGAQIRFRVE